MVGFGWGGSPPQPIFNIVAKGEKMARKKPEIENSQEDRLALIESKIKGMKKKYGDWSSGIISETQWPDVKEWIPTGSTWLDSIVKEGCGVAGYPVGRCTEIAGLSGVGKSYLAAIAIRNAQKLGFFCILCDSEMAADTAFLASLGVDIDKLLYVGLQDVEMYFEVLEDWLDTDLKLFVVWDTPANTKARGEEEKSFEPTSTMALKARTISKGFAKVFSKIIEKQPTLLICNQLKRNLDQMSAMSEPWVTPGGETIKYVSSLRLFLTSRKSKAHRVLGPGEQQIGSEIKVKIVKSRFGSLNRECAFKIIWNGPNKGIMDEESWFEAIKSSDYLDTGAWNTLYMDNDKKETIKFQSPSFVEMLNSNPAFRARVLWILQDELVNLFQAKASSATGKKFYNVDEDEEES